MKAPLPGRASRPRVRVRIRVRVRVRVRVRIRVRASGERTGADVGDRLAREVVEGVDLIGVARRLVRVRVRGSGWN
jgi:hypothetical protein